MPLIHHELLDEGSFKLHIGDTLLYDVYLFIYYFNVINNFLICFPMDYRDFSVKSKVIISLLQTVKLSLSIFTVRKFVLSSIKYH